MRLPAEWEPQSAVLVTWPHDRTDWAPQLDAVESVYVQLCHRIATTAAQRVLIVCRDSGHRTHVQHRLRQSHTPPEAIIFALADSNDSWSRDYAPLACIDGSRIRLVDFRFNGWGRRFAAALDDRVTSTLFQQGVFGNASLLSSNLVLEGGAVETDGKGTLLATRSSVFSRTRNPGLTEAEAESTLRRLLGFRRFLWLDHGRISGDDTDGHIDTLARFCNPDCICHVTCEDPENPDYRALKRMQRQLQGFRRPDGNPYQLLSLPSPTPRSDRRGDRLPASYANFLVVNRAVLVPVYGDAADETACRLIGNLFPGRRVISIDCSALIRQHGSLHCIAMQLPALLEPSVPGISL